MMRDSFLSDAGWLFFAAWSAIIALVSLKAFGRDIFPSTTQRDSSRKDPL
jgi:hypothetical protein